MARGGSEKEREDIRLKEAGGDKNANELKSKLGEATFITQSIKSS